MGHHSLMDIIVYMHNFLKVWDNFSCKPVDCLAQLLACRHSYMEPTVLGESKHPLRIPTIMNCTKLRTLSGAPGFGKIGRYSGFASVFKMEMD